jgi:hypothetical protein
LYPTDHTFTPTAPPPLFRFAPLYSHDSSFSPRGSLLTPDPDNAVQETYVAFETILLRHDEQARESADTGGEDQREKDRCTPRRGGA